MISKILPRADFTKGNQWLSVWIIALPSLLNGFLETLYGFIDLAMIGKLGSDAIAGVGQTRSSMFISFGIIFASSSAITVLVSHYIGAKEITIAKKVGKQGLSIGLLGGIILSFIYFFLGKKILIFIGTSGRALYYGTNYVKYIAFSFLLTAITIVEFSILRGCGDTFSPLIVSLISNIFNIFFNYLFIYGNLGFPAMGVKGAAIATILARIIYLVLISYILKKSVLQIDFKIRSFFYFNFSLINKIIKLAIPMGLQVLVRETGRLTFVKILASFGMDVIAALNIGLRIESLCFMPGYAFSIATTTMVGQNLGARNYKRIEEAVKINMLFSFASMFLLAIPLVIFARPLVKVFTNEKNVIQIAVHYLYWMAISEPFLGIIFTSNGTFRGLQKPKFALLSDFLGFWMLRVPMLYSVAKYGYLLSNFCNLYDLAWSTISIATILQAFIITLILKKIVYKEKYI